MLEVHSSMHLLSTSRTTLSTLSVILWIEIKQWRRPILKTLKHKRMLFWIVLILPRRSSFRQSKSSRSHRFVKTIRSTATPTPRFQSWSQRTRSSSPNTMSQARTQRKSMQPQTSISKGSFQRKIMKSMSVSRG